MSDDFQRVKAAIDILQVITRETRLAMKGKHLEQCPFCGHHDCFSISPEKGLYHCFSGDCGGAGGDVFTFLQKHNNLSEIESLHYAARIAGIEIEEHKPKDEKRLSTKERIYLVALDHYRLAMTSDSVGHEWFCKKRGHSPSTMDRLKVGWSNADVLGYLKNQGFNDSDIIKSGLASNERAGHPSDPHDAFWKIGVAIFPVFDHAGDLITFTAKDPDKQMKNTQLKGVTKNWFLNYPALGKHEELFLVEGENDVASLLDAGFMNVIGSAGQPGKDQYQLLKNHLESRTLILWYDQDKQKDFKKETGGPSHIRKIYNALSDDNITIKIITHPLVLKKNAEPAKDPDDYIQHLFQTGLVASDVRQAVKDLASKAQEPIGWEISRLASIDDPKDRLLMFKERGLARMIHEVPGSAERELYIDQAAKTIEISVKATEELVRNAVADLLSVLDNAYGSDIKKADPRRLAERIFQWFTNGAGARFYKTRDGKVWLFYNRRNYEITADNLDFNTLMDNLTHLAVISKPGNEVWYYLRTMANTHGELVDIMSWLHTDRERDIIYLNLNSEHNKILMLVPGQEPKMIDNGTNEHSVLLASSLQIHPFAYKPNTSEAESFTHLKTLLMDTVPAETPQRYFSICWLVSIFLMNYSTDRGLLQAIGSTKVGKSKIPERATNLIYGESFVGKGTGAAETRMAVTNPLIVLDNLENKNLLQGTVDFMLFMANSAYKPKAKSGSDTEVLFQKLNAMCMITSIEAFPGKIPELVNRTWPLMLEKEYKQPGYLHDETMRQIKKYRNELLSIIFRMISMKVLPRLERRRFWSEYLQTKHAGHNKDRNNEHLCTIILILEALLEYLPIPNSPDPVEKQATKIVDQWIFYHEEQARDTEVTSNSLLGIMDGLADEIITKIRGRSTRTYEKHDDSAVEVFVYEDPEYRQEFLLTEPAEESIEDVDDPFVEPIPCQRLEMVLHSAKLDTIIQRFCSNIGKKNPFETATALAYRIRNDKSVLESAGWSIISGKNGDSHYKKIRNQRYWKFSKLIKRLPL